MRLFASSLNEDIAPDLTGIIDNALVCGNELSGDTVYWFRPYLSSDFPEITCDKDYFFIWSTDHDTLNGKTRWGKGDNLDMSDFQEVGVVIEGPSSEAPFLFRIDDIDATNNEVLMLYYHPNPQPQSTRLYTSSGGSLTGVGNGLGTIVNADWNFKGIVLTSSNPIEPHTGYLKMFKRGVSDYRTIHLYKGGQPQIYMFSDTSDGINFTDIYSPDLELGLGTEFTLVASYGWYFNLYGQDWFLGTVNPRVPGTIGDDEKTLVLMKTDSDMQPNELIAILNSGNLTGVIEVYLEGNFAYIYFLTDRTNVNYGIYDLRNLLKYL